MGSHFGLRVRTPACRLWVPLHLVQPLGFRLGPPPWSTNRSGRLAAEFIFCTTFSQHDATFRHQTRLFRKSRDFYFRLTFDAAASDFCTTPKSIPIDFREYSSSLFFLLYKYTFSSPLSALAKRINLIGRWGDLQVASSGDKINLVMRLHQLHSLCKHDYSSSTH